MDPETCFRHHRPAIAMGTYVTPRPEWLDSGRFYGRILPDGEPVADRLPDPWLGATHVHRPICEVCIS